MADKKKNFHFPKYVYDKIDSAYIPSKVYVSLKQEHGGICKSCVKPGDIVDEGQLIATGKQDITSIHAPIPGIICAEEELPMPDGTSAQCIVIEFSGSFSFTGRKEAKTKTESPSKILSQIKKLGIINMCTDMPTSLAAQINTHKEEKTLGVFLFDRDPGISVNKILTQQYTKEIFIGARLCAQAMHADGILFFCCDKNQEKLQNPELIELLQDIPHAFIKTDCKLYPNASPYELNVLIKKAKTTLPDGISAHMKICIDSATAFQVYNSITFSSPMTETFVEVNGGALHKARVFSVKIGTPIRKLLEECGGTQKIPSKIVTNGLLKGSAVCDLHIPVTKYLKCITLLSSAGVPDQKTSTCTHCGSCRNICPKGLLPDILYGHHVNKFPVEDEIFLSVHLCEECALCNTVCPARLSLYQIISKIKDEYYAKNI